MGAGASQSQPSAPVCTTPSPRVVRKILKQGTFVPINEQITGVKLSAVRRLIKSVGEQNLRGMATYAVVDRYIKPMTREANSSWTAILANSKLKLDHEVGKAELFVSHAWGMDFLTVIKTVELFLQKQNCPDKFVWLDVVCVCQHMNSEQSKDTTWFLETFMDAVGQMGTVLMILSPWNDPVPIQRAWCVWELFSCLSTEGHFKVAFPPDQLETFVDAVTKNPQQTLNHMFAKLRTENSQCGNPEETDPLKLQENEANFQAIMTGMNRRNIGFRDLDKLVLTTLRDAVMDELLHLARETGVKKMRKGLLLSAVGSVSLTNGKYETALEACEEATKVLESVEGKNGSNRISVLGTLGVAYSRLEQYDKALQVTKEVLAVNTKLHGHAGLQTLNAKLNMSSLLTAMDEHETALAEQMETLETSARAHGPDHEVSLRAKYFVGRSHYYMKEYDRCAEVLEDCLQLRRRVLGSYHSETAASMFWLGKAYYNKGEFAMAEKLLQEAVSVFDRNGDPLYSVGANGWLAEASALAAMRASIWTDASKQ